MQSTSTGKPRYSLFVERLVEHAYGALQGKKGRVGYINFLTRITPDATVPWSDASIVPDIAILAHQIPWRSMRQVLTGSTSSRDLPIRCWPPTVIKARTSLPGCGQIPTGNSRSGTQNRLAWGTVRTTSSPSDQFFMRNSYLSGEYL